MNDIQISLKHKKPILYTFRRCPYAIRARLAIQLSGVEVEYREVLLREKPAEILKVSPKGTIPVLIINNETVIDESLDIIFWALQQSDPKNLLTCSVVSKAKNLIHLIDTEFKAKLDLYKYAVRFPKKSEVDYRNDCLLYLQELNELLERNKYLFGSNLGIADIAIFPFIRQLAFVDKQWFDSTEYDYLKAWLSRNLESELFQQSMVKREVWKV